MADGSIYGQGQRRISKKNRDMVSVYRVLVTVRKNEAFIFFSERANQKPRNRSDKFFEFTLCFILMIPQIFEFFQKYGFPRIVFFRK